MDEQGERTGALIRRLRDRAARTRTSSSWFLFAVSAVLFALVALYTAAEAISTEKANEKKNEQKMALIAAEVLKARRSSSKPSVDAPIDTDAEVGVFDGLIRLQEENEREMELPRLAASAMPANVSETEARYNFLSTIATRVGVVVILVFATTFFISGYRYTLRLAAAYDAQADALELGWEDRDLARRFTSVDAVLFDRTKAPTQEALDIAARLLKEERKG